jgi:hypothetical protein
MGLPLHFCARDKSVLSGYEVLTAVTIKSSVLWDIMLSSPIKVIRRFEGTYRHSLFDAYLMLVSSVTQFRP